MTRRAVIIGLLGSFFIAGAGYINDRILELESFNSGHQLPVIVLGVLFLLVVSLNPLLTRLRPDRSLRPAELALIVTLAMVSCSIPGRGLMEQFTQVLVMPFHWNRVTPGWKEHGLLEYVPRQALVPVDEENYDRVVSAYIMGAEAKDRLPPPLLERLREKWERVPWDAWLPPLRTWLPMILLLGVCLVCLSTILHRQWSRHEFLSYPIADFTASLVERDPGRAFPRVFGKRLFWIGFWVVLGIRLNNGLCVWFPDYLIPVQLGWRLQPFGTLIPWIYKVQWGSALLYLNLFPLVVAFAYFLSSEISLTLGISQFLWALVALPMVTVGVNLSTDWIGGWQGWQRAGSYLAFALILAYTGRQYYKEILVQAVRFRGEGERDPNVWAARILAVAALALTVLIAQLGLEWPFAAILVFLMLLACVVLSRISAETGLFFIQPRWMPFGVMIAAFGGYTMPPQAVIIAGLCCMVLCVDQSQSIMPYLVNGLKLCERMKLHPAKVAGVNLAMYAAGVVLAIVVVLVAIYDFGAPTNYNWSHERLPTMSFRAAQPEVLRLKGMGNLEEAESLPWYRRLGRIAPADNFVWAFGLGFSLVLVFSALRLRVHWWPLHPVMFLLWATYPMSTTCWSFFIGWMIKKLTVRFGGDKASNRLRPLMIGIIAAEVVGALIFMIAGAVFFFWTGRKPLAYRYFPR
ncbi:MAG: hypothetical protein JXR77_02735 [Lentisphaeria bacterium]|nr:hypothetical protein [Lentisphaeria bacterium]